MPNGKIIFTRIQEISIKNYKGIDSLSLNISKPRLPDDPDILVMGSENGLGKTSVLECCALLLLCLRAKAKKIMLRGRDIETDVPDLLIRTGSSFAEISGRLSCEYTTGKNKTSTKTIANVSIKIPKDAEGLTIIDKTSQDSEENKKEENEKNNFFKIIEEETENEVEALIQAICGSSLNPVIDASFLLFHSYRKVQEGNPELGMMVSDPRDLRSIRRMRRMSPFRRIEFSVSEFKLLVIRELMNKAKLFEFTAEQAPEETIAVLNKLVKYYAGGTVSKLGLSSENTVDFRITVKGRGASISFDGLSSGQKEMISTLFLIWFYTKNNPLVVFIDEPELHLNAQWHRSFISKMLELAPRNQYFFATHSEDIMGSVDKDRRILLERESK